MAERLISQNQSASGVVLCIRIMGNVTSGHDGELEDIHLYMYVHSYVCAVCFVRNIYGECLD